MERCLNPLVTCYLEALVRLASCAPAEVDAASAAVLDAESLEPVRVSRTCRFVRHADTDTGWLLRYAVGCALGHACDARAPRGFGIAAVTAALGARVGAPVALLAAAGELRRRGVLERGADGAWALAGATEAYLLGAPLEGPGLQALVDAPRGAADVAEAAVRLASLLRPGVPLVMHAPDVGVARALAEAITVGRGRALEAFAYTGEDDPIPGLRAAAAAGGFDVLLVLRPFGAGGLAPWSPEGGAQLYLVVDPDDALGDVLLGADPAVDLAPLCRRVDASLAAPAPAPMDRDARALALHQALYPGEPAPAAPAVEARAADPLWKVPECTLDDLVLAPPVRAAFDAIVRAAQAGRRAVTLLHGPPGTGKSLTARALAGTLGRPLYRLQGGLVRGRWYGELEQRLDAVMAEVGQRGAVLLIDEADEWLGRRVGSAAQVGSGHIVECSYMLQALEHFDGVAVLTTNRGEVMDPALSRRIDAWIHLPLPEPEERMALWVLALGAEAELRGADLVLLASVPITGGEIVACVREVGMTEGALAAPALMAAARRRAER